MLSFQWKYNKCKWWFSLLSFCGPFGKEYKSLGNLQTQAENSWPRPPHHFTPECAGICTAEGCDPLRVCCRLTKLSLQIIHSLSSVTATLSSAPFPRRLFFKDTCGGNIWSSRDDWEFDDCRLERLVQALFLALCLRAQVLGQRTWWLCHTDVLGTAVLSWG